MKLNPKNYEVNLGYVLGRSVFLKLFFLFSLTQPHSNAFFICSHKNVLFSPNYYYHEALYNTGRTWFFQLVLRWFAVFDDATQTPKGKSYTLMNSHREKFFNIERTVSPLRYLALFSSPSLMKLRFVGLRPLALAMGNFKFLFSPASIQIYIFFFCRASTAFLFGRSHVGLR